MANKKDNLSINLLPELWEYKTTIILNNLNRRDKQTFTAGSFLTSLLSGGWIVVSDKYDGPDQVIVMKRLKLV